MHDASFAGSAGILWTAGYKDTELGRYDIQTFADIFANDVALGSTAANDIGCNNLFDAREVLWQDTAPDTRLWCGRFRGINCFILGMHNGHGRFDVFQGKVILIRMALLGLRAIERAFEVSQQLLKTNDAIFLALDDAVALSKGRILRTDLGLCRNQQGFERINIIRKISGRSHAFDLSKSGLIRPCKTRPESFCRSRWAGL